MMTRRYLRFNRIESVEWRRTEVSRSERVAAAERVVSILLGTPSRDRRQAPAPSSTALRTHTRAAPRRVIRAQFEHADQSRPDPIGRPGTGGRMPQATPYSATSATADLIERLGQPHRYSVDGVQLMSWTDDPEGEGIG